MTLLPHPPFILAPSDLLRANTKFCIIRLRSLCHLRCIDRLACSCLNSWTCLKIEKACFLFTGRTFTGRKQKIKWQPQNCLHCQRLILLHYLHQKIFQEEMVIFLKNAASFVKLLLSHKPGNQVLTNQFNYFLSSLSIMNFQSIAANSIPSIGF